jgi:hypothetical protein
VAGVIEQQGPPNDPSVDAEPRVRPEDVDTGFWLWIFALPLMVAGYLIDLIAIPVDGPSGYVCAVSGVFVVVLASVVLTFLLLMRQGYRWARTLLAGGAAATVVYAASNVFGVERPPVAAVGFAVTTITGTVAILGGLFLLHRKDAHEFFVR